MTTMQPIIDITHPMIHWDRADGTFSAELSDIEEERFTITNRLHRKEKISVRNPKTGTSLAFRFASVDTDGEDVFGWWYAAEHNGRTIRFLFIND